MNTARAAHSQPMPAPVVATSTASGHEHDRRADHGPGQERQVAGPDQHAVEHEGHGVDRLHEAGAEQQERGQRLDRGVVGEHAGQRHPHDDQHQPEGDAHRHAPLDHAAPGRPGGLALTRPQRPADQGLAGDGHGVEAQGQEAPHLERHLVGGDVDRAEPGGDGGGDEERDPQGRGAHQQVDTHPGQAAHGGEVGHQRDARPPGGPGDPPHVGEGARALGDHGRERRGADPVAEAEDEHRLEDEVGHGGGDGDHERGGGVLGAAQEAGAGQREQQERHAGQADAQVDEGVGPHLAGGAQQVDQRAGGDEAHGHEHHADGEGQPQGLDGLRGGPPLVAGADPAADRRGRAVGQEHEDGVEREQDARRHRQPGQLGGAEVPDDRRVGEDVDGLGDQRPERRDRQPGDLAVVRAAPAAPAWPGPPWPRRDGRRLSRPPRRSRAASSPSRASRSARRSRRTRTPGWRWCRTPGG